MQYRIDQKSGNKLSVLGFGCMRFPRGLNMKIDMDKTEKLVLSAIERGVNYFDTAYVYGGSEEALGEVLHKNGAREKIFIATKLPYQKCVTYDDFDRLFNEQTTRLKTDYFDYYLIHNISESAAWNRLREMGIEDWIAEKKASGGIRRIGFSFHGAQNEFFELLDAFQWDFCQIQYNYINENYQAGRVGLQRAYVKGLPVVIMEPLLGGKLAVGLPKKAAKLFGNADGGLSPAAWALRWLWDQPEVTVVLSGMSTLEQLDDNLKTSEDALPGMLTDRESGVFSEVISAFRETYKIPCTGCNYCMPCPQEVNIPECFAAYNVSYTAGFMSGIQQYVTSTGITDPKKNHGGRACVKCGKCEKLCPQHIAIMDSLEAVTKRMEPFWFNTAFKIVRRFL
ncbi:aldo/keto reductase [Clostridia bacterium]|nr:aldo/keto reductase [Clostridia bacterium]